MMKRFAATLCAGACALAFAGWKGGDRVHSFSEMPGGHVLKIDMQTTGCFGGDANYFIFHAGSKPMLDIAGSPTLTLSARDIKGLDKLLDFYRHVKKGFCTSTDTVTIEEYRGDALIAKETFVDGTCSTIDEKETFSLRTLTQRAHDLKKRQP